MVAYVLRFVHNYLHKKQDWRRGEITVKELKDASAVLVRLAQAEDFGEELERLKNGRPVKMTSPLLSLAPFLDKRGTMRVGGRLQHSKQSGAAKHQMILSGHHPYAKLMIHHAHHTLHHAGFQLLWANLQREVWITNARPAIRNIIRKCLLCKRLKAKVAGQLMGSLPKARVTPSKPFQHTGTDYAGPFQLVIKSGRGVRCFKGYFCLFVCLATKAVHLEAVTDLTSEAFINCLKRFVSRRGMPSDIYSDCGTNYIGAERELKSYVEGDDFNHDVSQFLSDKGVQWHFNSPAAPHHGGLWEAGVKSVKYHLRRIIGKDTVTLEEFRTILSQVEAALNSRPLCALSTDREDLECLTPGHFLIGGPLVAVPEPDLTHLKVNRLSRWQRAQQMFQHFWRRWSKEYLHSLQQRRKWTQKERNIDIGDLVLVKDDNLPPLKWSMGRIVMVNPGTDGLIRIVKVKTATGEYDRPIVKICPLLNKEDL